MMHTAGIILHFTLASLFGLFGFSWISNSGYGFLGGVVGFVAGVGFYCGVLAILALLVYEFLEWLDKQ